MASEMAHHSVFSILYRQGIMSRFICDGSLTIIMLQVGWWAVSKQETLLPTCLPLQRMLPLCTYKWPTDGSTMSRLNIDNE
jgi:hypothetical protein